MEIAIIGAGMAGFSCAAALQASGPAATLFDKGRGPGGRMSTRRVATPQGEASFDHGAQYFTVRDPAFAAQVADWQASGVAAPWPAAGAAAWVGTPAMSAPVKQLAQGASVQWAARVDRLTGAPGAWRLEGDGVAAGPFGAVLLAVPAENAAPLLQGPAPALAARAIATPAQPCWTVMAAFAAPVGLAADVHRGAGVLGWAARNRAKPGRSGPEAWVLQADPDWSRARLEDAPAAIVTDALAALAAMAQESLPPVLSATAHRWRYARSGASGEGLLWDPALRLGVCGDWLLGPRVESAWLSGRALAHAVRA